MQFLIIAMGVLFSLFSVLVLSYISMATMVGPWIAPTLVLFGHMIFSFKRSKTDADWQAVAWMQAIGAGGGIIATGVGFALPTLFFLEPATFDQWLASPWYFCLVISTLCLIAGGLGLWLGRFWRSRFIEEQQLPFPVSSLTTQIITSQSHPQQTHQLMGGISGTLLLCFLRDGFRSIPGFMQKTYYLLSPVLEKFSMFNGKELALSIWPSLWAIGFTVGFSITIPLLVGLLSKYLVIYPLANHANFLPFALFSPLPTETFTIAFCSGLVLCELLINLPGYLKKGWKWLNKSKTNPSITLTDWKTPEFFKTTNFSDRQALFQLGAIIVGSIALLSYFKFSIISQILFLIFTVIATYSINQLGGKIGMIPFGRYSTFIVVPLLLLFGLSAVQATVVCVFFNICAAAASDLLFDYKTAQTCSLDQEKMYHYQWIGLVATAIGLSVILWLLFTHLSLGSEALFAQRGKAKALLLQSLHFDTTIVFLGIIFGWILKQFKINPTMVFGGMIMPNGITFGLVLGSASTLLVKKTEQYQSICAGILAAESLWVLIGILAGML